MGKYNTFYYWCLFVTLISIPIVYSETLGYTSEGSSNIYIADYRSPDIYTAYVVGDNVNATENGTVTTINAYVYGSNVTDVILAIYETDYYGTNKHKLIYNYTYTDAPIGPAWIEHNLTETVNIENGNEYTLGIIADPYQLQYNLDSYSVRYDSVSNKFRRTSSKTVFEVNETEYMTPYVLGGDVSIYITYTPDDLPPNYYIYNVSDTIAETEVTFYSNWTDDIALDEYRFSFFNGTGNSDKSWIESFESGALTSNWSTYSSETEGRIRVSGDYDRNGYYGAIMDRNPSGSPYNLNEIITNQSFAGTNYFNFSFYYQDIGDETNNPANHTDHYNGDGVYFTCNGSYWYNLGTLTGSNDFTNYMHFDLTTDPNWCGTVNDSFAIKWTQYDNYPTPSDGIAIDDIEINWSGDSETVWDDEEWMSFNTSLCTDATLTNCWANMTDILPVVGTNVTFYVTVNDSAGKTNQTPQYSFLTTASTDVCTYTSGNYSCDCSNYDSITAANLPNNYLILTGTGTIWLDEQVNATGLIKEKTCTLAINKTSGSFRKVKS